MNICFKCGAYYESNTVGAPHICFMPAPAIIYSPIYPPPSEVSTPTTQTEIDWRTRALAAEARAEKAEREMDEAREALAKAHLHVKERLWLDMTPDEDLPRRILRAYLDDESTVATVSTSHPALAEAINAAHRERVEILRRALAVLS